MEADTCTTGVETQQLRFRAMGTSCHVLVTGPQGTERAAQAKRRITELEHRWSRFLPTSEVSQLNAGGWVTIAAETASLIEHAQLAHAATSGVWNPLLGNRIAELGYDRSFDIDLAGRNNPAAIAAPGAEEIMVDPNRLRAQLPAGTALDVGGIAKGFAADLVSSEVMAAGAWGALVNLGGDLRVRGLPPTGLDWTIEIGGPTASDPSQGIIALAEGAIATSTTARRRWKGPSGERHHLLDPRTSLCAATDIETTSAIAGETWWAEAAATALTINPDLVLPSIAALQHQLDGTVIRINDFEKYERHQR